MADRSPAQAGMLKPPAPLNTPLPPRAAGDVPTPPQAVPAGTAETPTTPPALRVPPQNALEPITGLAAPAAPSPLPSQTASPAVPQARPAWQPAGLRPASQVHAPAAIPPEAHVPQPVQRDLPASQDAAPQRRVLTQTIPQQSPHVQQYAQPYAPFGVQPAPRAAYTPARGTAPQPVTDDAPGERTRRRRAAVYHEPPAGQMGTPAPLPQAAYTPPPAAPHAAEHTAGQGAAPALQAPQPLAARQHSDAGSAAEPSAAAPQQTPAHRQHMQAPQPVLTPPHPAAAQDALDDDSGYYAAVPLAKVAEPVTVPTFDAYLPRRKKTKRGLWITLLTLLLLGAALATLYFTGLLSGLLGTLFPGTAGDGVPSIFSSVSGAVDAESAVVQPATQVVAPRLDSVTVSSTEAEAPAALTATLTTNAATTAIRLLREDHSIIHTIAYASPQGDGLLWNVEVSFEEPYAGKVLVYLRDANGQWSEGESDATVAIR